jgi:hypothetical protein
MRRIELGPRLPPELAPLLLALEAPRTADPRAAPLVDFLSQQLQLELRALILYGSFARGGAGHGDIDGLIVTEEPCQGGLWGRAGDAELDLYLDGRAALLAGAPETWLHVAGGVDVIGADAELGAWLAALRARAQAPRAPVALSLRDRVWLRRMLGRIEGATDQAARALQLGRLLSELPELHRQARGWPEDSVSGWLRRLRQDEPALAEALDSAGAALGAPARAAALERCVELLLADPK